MPAPSTSRARSRCWSGSSGLAARKPRIREERITLAHGAGGKATHTLIEAVFLDAFRNPLLEPLEDGAIAGDRGGPARVHHRLVRRLAAVLPRRRHRRPRRQRHGQRPGDVRGAAAVPVVPASSSRRASRSPTCSGSSPSMAAAAAARPGCRSSPATPRSSSAARPTAATSRRPGVGLLDRACDAVGRGGAARATSCSCPGPIGDHGITIMLARGELDIEADIVSDTAPLHELTAALLDAVPDGVRLPARRHPRRRGDDLQRDRGGVAGRGRARRGARCRCGRR